MAFSARDRRIFATTDWEIMQRAHNQASRLLDRCPKTHERCNDLARIIMAIFESGIRDEDELAAMAANRELNFLAGRGHFQKPFPVRNLPKAANETRTEH
ncbi:hypothetical protein [Phyllobacterium lublinensis]|uniref:hypothetical protein n=1 Tax=Phyllobacterium lublinensis TaxID=2875708 RepID=UPI001CCE26BD|nr:hypothetical protein [Phyllobacterium sp. 2063]MBZ9654595.1 hypothetical protein [Phyllobacterium sp. 2063]